VPTQKLKELHTRKLLQQQEKHMTPLLLGRKHPNPWLQSFLQHLAERWGEAGAGLRNSESTSHPLAPSLARAQILTQQQ